MLHAGVCSVTFRRLPAQEVIRLAVQAGLKGIEWGGDIHVPHGNLSVAREVVRQTRDAGLEISSYGSYYRVGHDDELPFEKVLETARVLEVPVVRVWAGKHGSRQASPDYRQKVVDDSRRIAEMCRREGLTACYEYHSDTLTDTSESAQQLMEAVGHPAMRSYWQPTVGQSASRNLSDLRRVLPRLVNVHVYWWTHGNVRGALHEGEREWQRYLWLVARTGREHWLLLEFVRGDSPEALLEDASTLKRWLGNIPEG